MNIYRQFAILTILIAIVAITTATIRMQSVSASTIGVIDSGGGNAIAPSSNDTMGSAEGARCSGASSGREGQSNPQNASNSAALDDFCTAPAVNGSAA